MPISAPDDMSSDKAGILPRTPVLAVDASCGIAVGEIQTTEEGFSGEGSEARFLAIASSTRQFATLSVKHVSRNPSISTTKGTTIGCAEAVMNLKKKVRVRDPSPDHFRWLRA